MTMARCFHLAPLGLIYLLLTGPAGAQNEQGEQDEQDDFLEISPPEAIFPVGALNQLLLAGSNLDFLQQKSVISKTALVNTAIGPIGACFIDGDPALFDDVIRYAKEWELSDTSVRFDFGTAATRYCQPNAKQLIRISFAGKGTWSLIGLEGQFAKGATMNFSSLENWKLASERKFRRAVQHEFGHALGLYHEHQNPDERCDLQIDWKAAGELYRGKGFNLTDDEIKHNIGLLTVPVVSEGFDLNSIMLYDLPRKIFKPELFYEGRQPSCYTGRVNFAITPNDIATIKKYYPQDPTEVLRVRQAAFERARTTFRTTTDGQVALAIVSSYFPFTNQADALPYVAFAQNAIEAQADK